MTSIFFYSVSHPPHIILPIANWEPKKKPSEEGEIGPLVQHIYEVRLALSWPL